MRKASILVVDDNKITTKLLRRYLEANGYEAREAFDGIDCLEKVDEKQPDAIVLDVMMPRMDGYETVKKLKEQDHTKHIPVVIVTALNDVPNQLKSIDSGADDFLSKPIEEKLLIAKVKLLSTLNIHALNAEYFMNLINETASGNISSADAKQKAVEYAQ